MTGSFALDKENAKLMGVCAGLARMTGTDPFLVRIGTFVLGLFLGPLLLLAYLVVGWIAPDQA